MTLLQTFIQDEGEKRADEMVDYIYNISDTAADRQRYFMSMTILSHKRLIEKVIEMVLIQEEILERETDYVQGWNAALETIIKTLKESIV